MIAVVQRVDRAAVRVQDRQVASIGRGLVVLVAAVQGDGAADVELLARRLPALRVFPDESGRMNRSLADIGGAILLVSQFTLAGETRKGRRPSFVRALAPELAEPMIERLGGLLRDAGVAVAAGVFGAHMQLELVNDGPVTLLLDSRETRRGDMRDMEHSS